MTFAVVMVAPVKEALPGLGGRVGIPATKVTSGGVGTTSGIVAPIAGDIDCSSELSAVDALHVLRYVAQLPGTPDCLFAADVQCDNDRDAVDALLILRHVASLAPTITPPGCPGIGQPLPDDPRFAGGVLVTAVEIDESYRVWLTGATGIALLYDLAWDRWPIDDGGFFNGPLRSGPGKGEHNAPWSWHLDPDETRVNEAVIESCTGRPSFVEQDVEGWIKMVGRYCPGVSQLVSVVDYRWMTEAEVTN
jgi:hypothetical protein